MKTWLITGILLFSGHQLFAQYLHYWDNSRRPTYTQPAQPPVPPPPQPPKETLSPPALLPLASPVKLQMSRSISTTDVPFNTVPPAPRFDRPQVVFHDWPDKCPGLSGAVPVLLNYVPPEIVLIVTEKYKGHLYSICTNKGQSGRPEYKLKVCKNGMIRYEYANYKGEILPAREE